MKTSKREADFTADPAFDGTKTLALIVAAMAKGLLVQAGLRQLVAEELGKAEENAIEKDLLAQGFSATDIARYLPHAVVMVIELRDAGVLKS